MSTGQASIKATSIGITAVFMWGTLALLTSWCKRIPPFELLVVCFGIAFVVSIVALAAQGRLNRRMLVIPKGAWLLGIGGLFGFHFFYFIAFRLAPPIHASLLASLWPLFMILMNALIHSERLAWWHVAGAFLGFSGAALLVTGGQSIAFNPAYGLGYLCALSCALIWSAYSVLNKRYSDVPTDSVSLLCGASSLLALPIHLSLETFVLPSLNEWLVILAMGLFPMGLAFFTWDYGLKQGNLRLLGLLSYVGPLISASLLILFGQAAPGWSVGIACLLITFGALLGSGRLNGLLPFLARKADTPA